MTNYEFRGPDREFHRSVSGLEILYGSQIFLVYPLGPPQPCILPRVVMPGSLQSTMRLQYMSLKFIGGVRLNTENKRSMLLWVQGKAKLVDHGPPFYYCIRRAEPCRY